MQNINLKHAIITAIMLILDVSGTLQLFAWYDIQLIVVTTVGCCVIAIQAESDGEPDTDFLPDPDKIYGPVADEDSDSGGMSGKRRLSDDDADDDADDDVTPSDANDSASESSSDSDTSQSSDQPLTRYMLTADLHYKYRVAQ